MEHDCHKVVKKCHTYKKQANLNHTPTQELNKIIAPSSFSTWMEGLILSLSSSLIISSQGVEFHLISS